MAFKKITVLIFVMIVCAGFFSTGWADTIKFARYPNICKGKIAFTYHGDIWVADEDGSSPYRLTDHVAMDVNARFSPDGQWIAFSSDRMGNDDLWLIPVQGGEPRQLTFHTAGDTMLNWTPDGKRLIFSTSRRGTFSSPLYTVDLDGGLPMPMDIDQGRAGMISQDGKMLAFNRLGFSYWRKHYRGNNNTDIWLQDLTSREIRHLTDTDIKKFREHTQDAFPMWGRDGYIYFMSERDGIFNLWKISPEGGSPQQVTFHKKDGIQYPSISPDGSTIVYENEFELWRYDIGQAEPFKIPISIDFDLKENLVEYIHVDSRADGFAPSPDGRYLAVDSHGEIFIVPADPEVGEKTQVTASPWRDSQQIYSPDGESLAYVSDESGDWEIWIHDLSNGQKSMLSGNGNTKSGLIWSKDSKKLAWTASNRLHVSNIGAGTTDELAYNEANGFRLQDWSQDGNWLLYVRADDDSDYELYLFNTKDKKEFNVSQNPFRESAGLLTPDHKNLVFTSNRDNGVSHLFVLPLQRVSEDPDDPLAKEKKKQEDAAKAGEGGRESAVLPLKIDMEGIDRRAVQITEGDIGVGTFFLSPDGQKIYFTGSDSKGPGLFVIDLDGRNQTKLADGSFRNLTQTADGKMFFFQRENSIFSLPISGKGEKRVGFSFAVKVDLRKEWLQIFEECWRVMKYFFYDENMHGFDWETIKKTYRPFLQYVGNNQDLYDLTNEMIGELNASHTGVSGPTREQPRTYQTKYLGFEIDPAEEYYSVSHIYWNGPADKEWIKLSEGDYVIAIDGQKVKAGENYWKIINHAINDYVTVKVNSVPSESGAWNVRIKMETSLRNIKYEEWVKKNRDYVEELTNGEIAYVHIRSMNQSSLQRFENEIDQFHNRKGIIVDIRYNGGGNIDQELLDILERRPYEYWNSRWSSRPMGRRPRQAIAGPKVILINWRSASDSEVTPMGFRDLGLGSIVGNPTYGAVIATGSYTLINGGRIRRPGSLVVTYDPTRPNNYGINLENYGVAPDVWAENTPEDELKQFDRELKAAVDEVLRLLKEFR